MKFSTDFDHDENLKRDKYYEFLDLQPNTSVEKVYKLKVSNGNSTSMASRRKYGEAFVEVLLSNSKRYFFKVRI